MSISKQIFQLRREKRYSEALLLAKKGLKEFPDDEWIRKACAWVLYDLSKERQENGDQAGLTELIGMYQALKLENDDLLQTAFNRLQRQSSDIMLKIRAAEAKGQLYEAFRLLSAHLPSTPPSDRPELEQQLAWLIWKNLRQWTNKAGGTATVVTDLYRTWQELAAFPPPHKVHSLILQQLLQLPPEVRQILPWDTIFSNWNFTASFTDDDWLPYETPDGKRLMPLAEKILYAYARFLLKHQPPFGPETLLRGYRRLETIQEKAKGFEWMPFFMGKLWLAAGQDPAEARAMLLPFLQLKQRDFWSWSLLADTFTAADKTMELACLCRAMTCPVQPRFLQRVRLRLINLCVEQGEGAIAKYELDQYLQIAREEGWEIRETIAQLRNEAWYTATNLEPGFQAKTFYRTRGAQTKAIFPSPAGAWTPGVIEWVDTNKGWAQMRYGKDRTVRFPTHLNPEITLSEGWTGEFQLFQKKKRTMVGAYRPAAIPTDHDFWRPFSGEYLQDNSQAWGQAGEVIIRPALQRKHRLLPGDQVSGWAIRQFDPTTRTFQWKALKINA